VGSFFIDFANAGSVSYKKCLFYHNHSRIRSRDFQNAKNNFHSVGQSSQLTTMIYYSTLPPRSTRDAPYKPIISPSPEATGTTLPLSRLSAPALHDKAAPLSHMTCQFTGGLGWLTMFLLYVASRLINSSDRQESNCELELDFWNWRSWLVAM
jgi:hypothetical protein